MAQDDFSPQQRAGIVAWHLACGARLRTCEVATLVGLSYRGAFDLLTALSGVLPIYQDQVWMWRHAGPDVDRMRN